MFGCRAHSFHAVRHPPNVLEDDMRDRIKLELDDLTVDSFETTQIKRDRGEGRPAEITGNHPDCTLYPSLHNTYCGCTPAF